MQLWVVYSELSYYYERNNRCKTTGFPDKTALLAQSMSLCVLVQQSICGQHRTRGLLGCGIPGCSQYKQPCSPLNCFVLVTIALAGKSIEARMHIAWTLISPAGVIAVIPVQKIIL